MRTDTDRLNDIEQRGYCVTQEIYRNEVGIDEVTWYCVFGINRVATGPTLRDAIDAADAMEYGRVQ